MIVIEIEGKYFSGLDFKGFACTNVKQYAYSFYNLNQAYAMVSFLLAGEFDLNPSEVEVVFLDV